MTSKLPPVTRIRRAYARHKARAGGDWHAYVTLAGAGVVVCDDAERAVRGYSVQKLAVAVALLDKADRGELDLGRRVRLEAGDVLGGSGIYHLQPVWGDELTAAGVLTALLLASDNTAVRLCGRLAPAAEINEILAAKGFTRTRVEPVADPARFLLGDTTARETHDLLARLAAGTLLGPETGGFLLRVLRGAAGYHDGVRRDMSSAQRARVATKHGADRDERGAARHEAGIMFDLDGAPALVYSLFADGLGAAADYGATHPAVTAHAALGRVMLECC
ncbi:serine hydrolase [Dactylosporangium sp. NPDC000555]|uniref:serine hydrolase n=1 Tax=Dactylosporangium sp. NPDC000555 TaxID=3154260 RepID=UPI003322FB10